MKNSEGFEKVVFSFLWIFFRSIQKYEKTYKRNETLLLLHIWTQKNHLCHDWNNIYDMIETCAMIEKKCDKIETTFVTWLKQRLWHDWNSIYNMIIWLKQHLCHDWNNICAMIGKTFMTRLKQHLWHYWNSIYNMIETTFVPWLEKRSWQDWNSIYDII